MGNCFRVGLALFCLLSGPLLGATVQTDEEARMAEVLEVVREMGRIPEKGIPPALLSRAEAIAIIPHVVKIGLIVGGRYGMGVALVRDEKGEWSNPVFVSIKGGSVGWQIGAHATDLVLVFRSRKLLQEVTRGKLTLGADAAVAAGPLGRKASAGIDLEFTAPIYAYSRSQGLFAGVAVDGAVFAVKKKENEAYYDSPGVDSEAIFSGQHAASVVSADELKKLLSEYSGESAGE
jgi:lipid-binding SYLF domain-containing protein